MEIPHLVRDRLEGEEVTAGVNLGDEDALCLTPSKTIVYKGEGLLSDESVSVFPHDANRLTVSEGRRKTKLQFTYVEGTRSFSVPANRTEPVLELVLGALLRVDGATDPDEAVEGVYRFSELTVIITEKRLVKHIGTAVWDEDYEEFPFADVTGLTFEQGSVATQIVLAVDGRPNRIKAPNDKAPVFRRTLEQALYAFHDVESVEELNALLGTDDEDAGVQDQGAGFGLESDIDPLVSDDEDEDDVGPASGNLETMETVDEGEDLRPSSMDVDPTDDSPGAEDVETVEPGTAATSAKGEDAAGTTGEPTDDPAPAESGSETASDWDTVTPESDDAPTESQAAGAGSEEAATTAGATDTESSAEPGGTGGDATGGGGNASGAAGTGGRPAPGSDAQLGPEEIEALETELAELREAVETQNETLRTAIESQNEVLRKQHSAIKRLISELRSD